MVFRDGSFAHFNHITLKHNIVGFSTMHGVSNISKFQARQYRARSFHSPNTLDFNYYSSHSWYHALSSSLSPSLYLSLSMFLLVWGDQIRDFSFVVHGRVHVHCKKESTRMKKVQSDKRKKSTFEYKRNTGNQITLGNSWVFVFAIHLIRFGLVFGWVHMWYWIELLDIKTTIAMANPNLRYVECWLSLVFVATPHTFPQRQS